MKPTPSRLTQLLCLGFFVCEGSGPRCHWRAVRTLIPVAAPRHRHAELVAPPTWRVARQRLPSAVEQLNAMHWRARTCEAALLLGSFLLQPATLHTPAPMPTVEPGDTQIDPPSRVTRSSAPTCGTNALPSLRLSSAAGRQLAPPPIVSRHADHRVAIAHGDRIDLVDLAAPRLAASWTAPGPITALGQLNGSILLAGDVDGRLWTVSLRSKHVAAHVAKSLPDPLLAILELPSEDALVVDRAGAWLVDGSSAPQPTWFRLPPIDTALTATTVSSRALIAGDDLGRVWRWDVALRPLPSPRHIGQLDEAVVELAACKGNGPWVIAVDAAGTATLIRNTTSRLAAPKRLATARQARSVAVDRSCTIAAVSDGITVSLWDLQSVAPEHASWSLPNLDPIRDIAISPDGLSLAVLAATTLRLWDLTDIARPPTSIRAPDDGPIGAYYSDSGRLLIATPSALAWIDPHSR